MVIPPDLAYDSLTTISSYDSLPATVSAPPTLTPSSPNPSRVPTTRTTEEGMLIVEAREVTLVDLIYFEAMNSIYRLAKEGGCNPWGCVGDNTRVSVFSRRVSKRQSEKK